MRRRNLFYLSSILCLALTFLTAQEAQAARWWHYIFPPDIPAFEKRMLKDGKTPHMQQWRQDVWTPEDWVKAYDGDLDAILNNFYEHKIIRAYDFDDGLLQSIRVGEGFMQLSEQDKVRVTRFLDYTYKLTQRNPTAALPLYHYKSGSMVGTYTIKGLQLQ